MFTGHLLKLTFFSCCLQTESTKDEQAFLFVAHKLSFPPLIFQIFQRFGERGNFSAGLIKLALTSLRSFAMRCDNWSIGFAFYSSSTTRFNL